MFQVLMKTMFILELQDKCSVDVYLAHLTYNADYLSSFFLIFYFGLVEKCLMKELRCSTVVWNFCLPLDSVTSVKYHGVTWL